MKLTSYSDPTTILSTIHNALFPFFSTKDACTLRLVNKEFNQLVTEYTWDDTETQVKGSIKLWRTCFPNACSLNVSNRNKPLNDSDCKYFNGLQKLNISRSIFDDPESNITDNGFEYFTNIISLNMSGCDQIYITNTAFKSLKNLKDLNISWCTQFDDIIFDDLKKLKILNISWCEQINDKSFDKLLRINTLIMRWCTQETITDKAFLHLSNLNSLDIMGCNQNTITDYGFINLTKLKTLDISFCDQKTITNNIFKLMRNLTELNISGCIQIDKIYKKMNCIIYS